MSLTARENILNKIKQALVHPVPLPFPETNEKSALLFHPTKQELEIEFAENFTQLQGKFSFCANLEEVAQNLTTLAQTRKWNRIYCAETNLKKALSTHGFGMADAQSLPDCEAAVTTCELLVARTGSMLLSSAITEGRTASVYAPVHICIAYTHQLVYDIKDGLLMLQEKYRQQLPSLISLASGPSRTADIEKTLVVGVHGPKEVFCFLVEE